jgi:predicted MFS family arabinose efflux permease
MLLAALPFYLYQITGSALASGGLFMAYVAPGALFGTVAGVFVDRWDRRRVLLVGNLLAAVLIPWLLFTDAVGASAVWVVYVVIFLESCVTQFLMPAENALLPTLVDEAHLVSANSLNALNDNLARVVGAALGAVLLGTAGFRNVVIIDAASYAVAAVTIALMSLAPSVAQAARAAGARWRQVRQEWVDGLRLVTRSPLFRNLFIVVGVGLLGDAILSALLAPFAQEVAGFSATDYGWVLAARGVGGLAGGLLLAQIGSKLSPNLMLSGGLLGTGLMLLAMILAPKLPVILSVMVVAGPLYMAWLICMQTVLQKGAEDRFRGRVFGAYSTVSTLLMFVGSGLGGSLADTLGIRRLMIAAAGIYMVAGALGWLLLRRPLRTVDLGGVARPEPQPEAEAG